MKFLGVEPTIEHSTTPGDVHIVKYRYRGFSRETGGFELTIEVDGVNWGYSLEVFGAFKHIGDPSFLSAYSALRSATRRVERLYRFTSTLSESDFC